MFNILIFKIMKKKKFIIALVSLILGWVAFWFGNLISNRQDGADIILDDILSVLGFILVLVGLSIFLSSVDFKEKKENNKKDENS
ncbi:MAG: hypothetical protein ACK5N8_00385 [Alphaproteobacteria bacterium]